MLKLLRQNQNIILTSIGLFLVSLTALLFLINNGLQVNHQELKTDVISYGKKESNLEEVKYRELVKNEDDPLFVLNLDGTIDFTSQDFLAASGYSPNKLSGRLFFSLIRSKDQVDFLSAISKAYLSEEPISMVGPFNIIKDDGSVSIYMGSLFPVKEDGKIKKIILTIKDITSNVEDSATDESVSEERTSDDSASDQVESDTAAEQEDSIVTTRPSRELRYKSRATKKQNSVNKDSGVAGETVITDETVTEGDNSEQISEPAHVDQPSHSQHVQNTLTPNRSVTTENSEESQNESNSGSEQDSSNENGTNNENDNSQNNQQEGHDNRLVFTDYRF